MYHSIETGDHPPIKKAPRRALMHQQETVQEHVDGSDCPGQEKRRYHTLVVCFDYGKLNNVTRKDAYNLR